jgi:hypothetical protein
MSLASDWHERHGAVRSRGRLLFYILLLAVTVFLMLRAGTIVETIAAISTGPDSSSAEQEVAPE